MTADAEPSSILCTRSHSRCTPINAARFLATREQQLDLLFSLNRTCQSSRKTPGTASRSHTLPPCGQGGYGRGAGQQQGAYGAQQQPQASGYGAAAQQQPAAGYGQQAPAQQQQQQYGRAVAPAAANAGGAAAAPGQQSKLAAIIAQVGPVSRQKAEN